MPSVPSFTSNVGYFQQQLLSKYRVRFRGAWEEEEAWVTIGTSYKTPTVKSNGILATNYTRKVTRMTSMQGPSYNWEWDGESFRRERTGDFGMHSWYGLTMSETFWDNANYGPVVSVPGWMTDQVIQQCITELNEFRANILEDLGQVNSTLGMMWNIFGAIVDAYIAVSRGDARAAKRILKRFGSNVPTNVSNIWLMYYYGIKPLISTIDALSQSCPGETKTKTCKRKVSDDALDVSDAVLQRLPGWIVTSSGKATRGAACSLTVAVDVDNDLRFWRTLGLSGNPFNDAVVTAWALLPYSFVIDWVLPVERFLRTRSWGSGIKYQRGSVTKQVHGVTIHTLENPLEAVGTKPKVLIEALLFERVAYNDFTPPSGLSLKLALTPTQAFNALALIVSGSRKV